MKLQELTPYGSGLAVLDPDSSVITPLTDGLVVLDPERYDKPVEIYIKESISEAYDLLIELSPGDLLPSKELSPEDAPIDIVKNQDGSGYIKLPEDFHSLKLFKMRGWERPVSKIITSDSPAYMNQFNPYLRGGVSSPVCAVIKTSEGKKLEYYSLPKTYREHKIDFGYYIPKLTIDMDNENSQILEDIDSRLIPVFIYLIVSIVQLIYEQSELSDKTKQAAIEKLQLIKIADNERI
ncbi:hypothetical protein ACFO6W_20980 [Dysgonomonas termitidis]|uniref:Uncharacterized protein n=1 Tax=Dysgonomonas termitidis TaxID=1516126 RepID=A0ABV9L103_9BACT